MIDSAFIDLDWQEADEFCPGTQVELKQRPGVVDTIAAYDPMMVPPIWLCNDPQPRYPEELQIVKSAARDWWGESQVQTRSYPACQILPMRNVAKVCAIGC